MRGRVRSYTWSTKAGTSGCSKSKQPRISISSTTFHELPRSYTLHGLRALKASLRPPSPRDGSLPMSDDTLDCGACVQGAALLHRMAHRATVPRETRRYLRRGKVDLLKSHAIRRWLCRKRSRWLTSWSRFHSEHALMDHTLSFPPVSEHYSSCTCPSTAHGATLL